MSEATSMLPLRNYFKSKQGVLDHQSVLEEFKGPIQEIAMGQFNDWVECRRKLFHIVFSDVGEALIVRENLKTEGDGFSSEENYLEELKTLQDKLHGITNWETHYQALKEKIQQLLKEQRVLFFVCNYFSPVMPVPRREPAVSVVKSVDASDAKTAYDIFTIIRASFMWGHKAGAYPINDLLGTEALKKKVWAIKFINGNTGKCHYLQGASTRKKWSVEELDESEPVTLVVPLRAFGGAPNRKKLQDFYLAKQHEKIIKLIESSYDDWEEKSDSNPILEDTLEKTLQFIKWHFFNEKEYKSPVFLKDRPKRNSHIQLSQDEKELTKRDAYVVLAALLPFVSFLNMTYHYAFPAYFTVPVLTKISDQSDEEIIEVRTYCSTLSVATKQELTVPARKILSDVAVRLLVTPLAQDYGIRLNAVEAKMNMLSAYLGSKINVEKILYKRKDTYWNQAVNVFTDISGFTKLYDTVESSRDLTDREKPKIVLDFLRRVWSKVTKEVHKYQGAVGAYLGDGIYFYFSGADPFKEKGYATDERDLSRKALACVLSLQGLLDEAWNEWQDLENNIWPGETRMDRKIPVEIKNLEIASFHVGMSIGKVVLGDLVGQEGFHFTGVSDVVNAAARMQELANRKRHEIIIHETIASNILEHLHQTSLEDIVFYDYTELNEMEEPTEIKNPKGIDMVSLARQKRYSTEKFKPFESSKVVALSIKERGNIKNLQRRLVSGIPEISD